MNRADSISHGLYRGKAMMVQHTSRGWENGRGRERGSIDYRVCVKEGEEEREGVECVKELERGRE